MRLLNFSITNYRSITEAHEIHLGDMTVLVGKNNEGKSNILSALSLAMDTMQYYARTLIRIYYRSPDCYKWERDFPIALQASNPDGFSVIDFLFELSKNDLQHFKNALGLKLANQIPVRVKVNGKDAQVLIPKNNDMENLNMEKQQKILAYISNAIDFNFIPTIRTEDNSKKVLEELLSRELATLERSVEYNDAVERIESLQQEILDNTASHILEPLQTFMPSIKNVQINIQQERRRRALRHDFEIVIDDGTPTSIQLKGDGIKSLAALAILNIPGQNTKNSLIAIEEPESHLHPDAARQLYETISELSHNYQVILTTHSPIFVNRSDIGSNIVVDSGRATPAKSVQEIRDALGTIVSDNLINAEYVLIVEGESDRVVLEKLLPQMSEIIHDAIHQGRLVIDSIGGAGNLSYKLSLYRNLQCQYHVLLDHDEAGEIACQQAKARGLLTCANVTYVTCRGSSASELEDCFNKDIYAPVVYKEFGVTLNNSDFRGNRCWSSRMKDCFSSQGKPWNDHIQKNLKTVIANTIPADPEEVLNRHKRSALDALVKAVENMLV